MARSDVSNLSTAITPVANKAKKLPSTAPTTTYNFRPIHNTVSNIF